MTNLFEWTYTNNVLVMINYCLTFNDDGVIRFVYATADRADGEKEKMNGRGKENC